MKAVPGSVARTKPLVIVREELFGQVPIGRRHLGDPGQCQFFGQPVLQGAEGALRPAPRFRRIGGDEGHPHLLQSAMHLRQPKLVDFPTGLIGVPVVGAPVGIEGTEEPPRLHDLPQAPEAAQRPFFLDEEGGVELGGRIIERHNQIPLTPRHSLMRGAVLVEHHAGQRFARPLLAVGPTSGSPGHVSPRL